MPDFKSAYAASWAQAAAREIRIAAEIASATGIALEPYGLGAGTAGRIEGYSRDYGDRAGSADYRSRCGRLHIEVTGPLKPVSPLADLWVRPDKIIAAADEFEETGAATILAHNTPTPGSSVGITRLVRLDAGLLARWRAGALRTVVARPRGFVEIYIAISAADPAILSLRDGCAALRRELAPRPLSPWLAPRRFAPPAAAVSRPAPRLVPAAAPRAPAPVIVAAPGRIPGALPRPARFNPFRQRERVAA
ncbi:hypothetical protein NON00_12905 [Roseomonas sp. GC11]|uniref:hypothetical protein n=1 Tax=Roseomonas sp. GC11 TaxID=2950546 RepID=UPI002108F3A2|nr:hypothetical protein [Roseomonas sp. GC11]MCQ4160827.1 hypothetical protein [Roseomonas sp. GC11]